MAGRQKSIEPERSIKKASVSIYNPNRNQPTSKNTTSVNPYIVPKDYVWRDIVTHEKFLMKSWESIWGSNNELSENIIDRKSADVGNCDRDSNKFRMRAKMGKCDDQIKSGRLQISSKSAERVRIQLPTIDYRKLFWTPGPLPIIRFVPEQYGHYRKKKYLLEGQKDKNTHSKSTTEIYSLTKHKVNPLVC